MPTTDPKEGQVGGNLRPVSDTGEGLFREHGKISLKSVSHLPYPGLTSILIDRFLFAIELFNGTTGATAISCSFGR